ncbi:MAG TPA: cupin [Gemmatimonadetes bacterium]|nr:cupin [Gemmatimonadota bacterium]HAT37343.1 cupin [Gemmatimonadota bacterium]HBV05758.1 cupin [Gemmatimonadota bacterium]|tara:strand:- start:422 stop:787 length:366 start_codon:yes stop_codon:yes gene_type:complete
MIHDVVNLKKKFDLFVDKWEPKVIAEMNDIQFKLVRVEGEFLWHQHAYTDEAFIVIEGELEIDLPNQTVRLCEGEMFVVPKGVEHRPRAVNQAKIMLVEPRGVVNTGDIANEGSAPNDVWI